MLGLLRRGLAVLEETFESALAEHEVATPRPGPVANPVAESIRLIQEHVDREARNRRLETLAVRDLCPLQKAELVRDLAHVLR